MSKPRLPRITIKARTDVSNRPVQYGGTVAVEGGGEHPVKTSAADMDSATAMSGRTRSSRRHAGFDRDGQNTHTVSPLLLRYPSERISWTRPSSQCTRSRRCERHGERIEAPSASRRSCLAAVNAIPDNEREIAKHCTLDRQDLNLIMRQNKTSNRLGTCLCSGRAALSGTTACGWNLDSASRQSGGRPSPGLSGRFRSR